MLRRLFTLLSALSLLLCAAVAVLWVRSYWVVDEWMWTGTSVADGRATVRQYELEPQCGTFTLTYRRLDSTSAASAREVAENPPSRFSHFTYHQFHCDSFWEQLGFAYTTSRKSDDRWGSAYKTVQLPAWLLLAAFGPSPAVWFLKLRRRRQGVLRRARSLCPSCGYDLRATPGRCPECGTPAAGKEA
jgi:hypothetical protein